MKKQLLPLALLALFLGFFTSLFAQNNQSQLSSLSASLFQAADKEASNKHREQEAPSNLAAYVERMHVILAWEPQLNPSAGEWLSWCNTEALGNSVGTDNAAIFDVAHKFDTEDLADYLGGELSIVKFVPVYANCVYTVKVWRGGTANAPAELVYSAVHENPDIGDWNVHTLSTPVSIDNERLWVGYEVNTLGGRPAGCDYGPPIAGKGDVINFEGWTTLAQIAPHIQANWSIQSYVTMGADTRLLGMKPAAEPERENSTLLGYKVYRDNQEIAFIEEDALPIFRDENLSNGSYLYGVSALYNNGESLPAQVQTTVDFEYPLAVLADSFEDYPDFAQSFGPWMLHDLDAQATVEFDDIWFPGSGEPMSFIVFNPSATTPPLETLPAHDGEKYLASFCPWENTGTNWLITPQLNLTGNSVLRFFARSLSGEHSSERFKVGLCLHSIPMLAAFNFISGDDYLFAPAEWTEYIYDLSAYDGHEVYLGIRHDPLSSFALNIDQFSVHTGEAVAPYNNAPPVNLQAIEELETVHLSWEPAQEQYACNYKLWRLKEGEEDSEAAWVLISPDLLNSTSFADTQWADLPLGRYKWAAKAYYGAFVSEAAFSNDIVLGPLPQNLRVSTLQCDVQLHWDAPDTIDTGYTLLGYRIYRNGEFIGELMDTMADNFWDRNLPEGVYIFGVTAVYSQGESAAAIVEVPVYHHGEPMFNDGFEQYLDFAIEFAPWTTIDLDAEATVGIDDYSWPNIHEPQAFIIFNRSQVIPPFQGVFAHYGFKMAACFAPASSSNNDWLISPRIDLEEYYSSLRFFAKSYSDEPALGRFKVAVSNQDIINLSDFEYISGSEAVQTSTEWIEYIFDLSAYNTQSVYLAIHCVSDAGAILFVDDFSVYGWDDVQNADAAMTPAFSLLKGNYPNPFNPHTTIRYSLKEAAAVSLEIYNLKGQLVKTLLNENKAAGEHSILWDGKDASGRKLASGIYYYRMKSANYSATKKMLLMK